MAKLLTIAPHPSPLRVKNGERETAALRLSVFSPSFTGRRCRQADEGQRLRGKVCAAPRPYSAPLKNEERAAPALRPVSFAPCLRGEGGRAQRGRMRGVGRSTTAQQHEQTPGATNHHGVTP